ncbi:LLM class F420-dependent oxidoreductase [Actinokineospora globicatena]|uniref:LLM class F420-dependent oxidoreductase n=1 Tax=Actinokineospora globicatena TaxID=103729 RepID=UPI0020A5BC0F|nr:LLM class F420-dependent oxidoreductase [Actinokineospora globicatena]MCP2303261.1 putative F420-dependent oxidoreductase, Rv2161c family [Actinokineospora globicatena]GLW79610.1 LLM class F420-dependent oxidoreductase [Actinokineospora globicatena]GLW85980.1 LLM class F420-dependent oxidoreductase [Actinokineospora globicatena]
MELGVYGLSAKATLRPAETGRLAALAEDLGYRSWWCGDHVVLPSPRVPESPMAPEDPILDPLIHLTYVAAVTTRIELGTGIVILPQRNPLVLAKQAASLDVLSGGRLLLGVAGGYLEPELAALGVPLSERGSRTDEYIDAMRALWNDPAPVAFTGKHVSFHNVDANPRPATPGGPRIVVGGHSPAAFRRVVARGHGWFGTGSSPDDLARHLRGLVEAARVVERPAALGQLEINFMQVDPVEVTATAAAQYADLGVTRLTLYPLPLEDTDDVARFLERHAALSPS